MDRIQCSQDEAESPPFSSMCQKSVGSGGSVSSWVWVKKSRKKHLPDCEFHEILTVLWRRQHG